MSGAGCRILFLLYRVYSSSRMLLRHHERQEACSRSDIQDPLTGAEICPGTEQNPVRTDLHRTISLVDLKLAEMKQRHGRKVTDFVLLPFLLLSEICTKPSNHMKQLLFCSLMPLLLLTACGKRNILSPKTDKAGIKMYQVRSRTIDVGIVQDRFPNRAYIAPEVTRRNQLLVFLGATNAVPEDYEAFPEYAASLGYHVLNLNYSNSPSVQLCAGDNNPECFERMREEVETGRSTSNKIFVNEVHSFRYRLRKMLEYLHQLDDSEGWGQYYTDTALNYADMVVAGHGQGAGHVAYIARKNEVARVILFSGPNDYSGFYEEPAAWAEGFFETDKDRFYAFSHLNDEVLPFGQQYAFWDKMELTDFGDTTLVEEAINGNPHLLYTRAAPKGRIFSLGKWHNAVVVDRFLAMENGAPELQFVWGYLLR